ncbi:MAG: hypothetical protein CGW95_04835 [Phenylobacterium zucineum]|nr:MAG: hypothetical protein CGW95_04835 [Phenylobacterium zucineum]
MAAGAFTLFAKNKDDYRINDIVGAVVKVALVTSAWTPNATATGNALWADVSANEIANGNGYTTGGNTVTGAAATATAGNNGYFYTSTIPAWTASGAGIPAHRYYVMYVVGTLWGQVNPLIGYFLGDATPADIPLTTATNTLTVTTPATGWFDAI